MPMSGMRLLWFRLAPPPCDQGFSNVKYGMDASCDINPVVKATAVVAGLVCDHHLLLLLASEQVSFFINT